MGRSMVVLPAAEVFTAEFAQSIRVAGGVFNTVSKVVEVVWHAL